MCYYAVNNIAYLRATKETFMLNLNSIMIGSANPKALAEFYEKVLDKKVDMQEGDWYGFSAGSCYLSIGFHDKVKGKSENPERIILNFETKEIKEEFQRIKALGATVIAELYGMDEGETTGSIATFADPDGNYFQLMTPWE
jgi:predicted enzyme related to lactoylglutathione lyase